MRSSSRGRASTRLPNRGGNSFVFRKNCGSISILDFRFWIIGSGSFRLPDEDRFFNPKSKIAQREAPGNPFRRVAP
jgi:hypothetical protein